jgi:hypothetical protein
MAMRSPVIATAFVFQKLAAEEEREMREMRRG